MRENTCLLLTATIEVKNKDLVKRNDAAVRLEDYKTALKSWLVRQESLAKIVFVENSGYPLDELKELVGQNNPYRKEVEFLSFTALSENNKDISLGELRAIEHALFNSRLLKSCRNFVKVTGRVFTKNIDAIINDLTDDFHVVSFFSENLSYVDSVIVIFEREFYEKMINKYAIDNIINAVDRTDFERVCAKAIHRALARDYRWYPFSVEPIIEGMSGTKDISYNKKYNWRRSLVATFCSRFYHRLYRNSYGKSCKRKHLFERWNILPK